MTDRFLIRLSEDQRRFLQMLLASGRCSPGTLTRAEILRLADVSQTGRPRCDQEVARDACASVSTVFRVRKRFTERGFQAALFPKGRPPRHRCITPMAGS